jgi:hypothetical protein
MDGYRIRCGLGGFENVASHDVLGDPIQSACQHHNAPIVSLAMMKTSTMTLCLLES